MLEPFFNKVTSLKGNLVTNILCKNIFFTEHPVVAPDLGKRFDFVAIQYYGIVYDDVQNHMMFSEY